MAENVKGGKPASKLSPTAMSITDAARVLTAAGGQIVKEEDIQADIGDGAPTNGDGTLNIVHYGAWLASEMGG